MNARMCLPSNLERATRLQVQLWILGKECTANRAARDFLALGMQQDPCRGRKLTR